MEEAKKLYLGTFSLEKTTRMLQDKYNLRMCRETLRKKLKETNVIEERKSLVKISREFKITIPIDYVRNLNVKTGDYIKVGIENKFASTFFYLKIPTKPKSRKIIQVKKELPKDIIDRLGLLTEKIVRIKKVEKVERPIVKEPFVNSSFDLAYIVPQEMMCETISKNGEEFLRLWNVNNRNGLAKIFELKRFIPLNKEVGEFFGLLQAEGSKRNNKLSFTNAIIEEHMLIVNAANKYFGLPTEEWSVFVHYSPKLMELDEVKKVASKFIKKLNLKKESFRIVEHPGLTKTNFQISISSSILSKIFNAALVFLRKNTTNFNEFCKGFISKVLIGDGTVCLSKDLERLEIVISEVDLDAQKDLVSMLTSMGIHASIQVNKINISTNFYSCIWFLENNIFNTHKENRKKFLTYILHNYYFTILFKRLNSLMKSKTVKKFALESNLKEKTARMYLLRNLKRGFVEKTKGGYKISEKGRKFLSLYKRSFVEFLTNLCKHPEELNEQPF